MDISGLDPSNEFAVRVQKFAQDQKKQEGIQIASLIDRAAPAPPVVGPHGEGSHVNTYA